MDQVRGEGVGSEGLKGTAVRIGPRWMTETNKQPKAVKNAITEA